MSVWNRRRNENILSLLATENLIVHLAALLQYLPHRLISKERMAVLGIVQLVTGWAVRGPNPRQRQQILSPAKHPDGLRGPSSLLINGQRRSQPRIKQHGREFHHSPAHSAENKSEWSYNSTSPYAFMACTGTTLLSPCTSFLENFVRRLYSSKTPGQELAHVWEKSRRLVKLQTATHQKTKASQPCCLPLEIKQDFDSQLFMIFGSLITCEVGTCRGLNDSNAATLRHKLHHDI